MLISGIGLPVLANEQELVIEEMEDGTTDENDSMDSSSSKSEDNSDNTNSDSTEDDLDENDLSDNEEDPEEIDDSNQNNGNLGLTIDGVTNNNNPLVGSNIQNKDDLVSTLADEYLDSGKIGTADWTISKNGTLTIGPGEFENKNEEWLWPWLGSKYRNEIKTVDGSASFILKGNSDYAFAGIPNVESINLSGWNTSAVKNMRYLFSECISLKSINLSNFNTSSVTSMGGMFTGCSSLQSIDLSKFNTSSVREISGMFSGCSSLTSINLSNFNTSSVTSMSDLFGNCSSLTSIDLSRFDTSSVKDMGFMFTGCSSLTSIDLSKFDTSSVTYISNWFKNCSSLNKIDGLSLLDTSAVEYMDDVFNGCTSLTSLDLSGWNTFAVKRDIKRLFEGCDNLYQIKYNGLCNNIIPQLSSNWMWYQHGYGPYTVEWLVQHPIEENDQAVIVREDHLNEAEDPINATYDLKTTIDSLEVDLGNKPNLSSSFITVYLFKNGNKVSLKNEGIGLNDISVKNDNPSVYSGSDSETPHGPTPNK
ncbi:MAG: BspA family leucine-rich repeat surface protein, partial [Allobaculum sp.]|nr:BspA family leucine-rich repeat surface protein [Allobaculum sp.]